MCGITGKYNFRSEKPVDANLIINMVQAIYHRGPDEDGFYFHEGLGMGMRRLSIIDLSTGKQPISNENKTVWVVFNGEIYNYKTLRDELSMRGHQFKTKSDTEVIVHGYEEWGTQVFERLNGIFSIALYDMVKCNLLLIRDQYGVKPLYYSENSGVFWFGSEIKSILQDSSIVREVDINSLNLYLTFRFVPSPYTMFTGIKKIPPGHYLTVTKLGTTLERYALSSTNEISEYSESEIIEILDVALNKAVQRQMISDVPIGALLSGGVDSSLIVALMSKLNSKPVKTFTVGFDDGQKVNEFDDAQKISKLFKTEHYEVSLNRKIYEDFLPTAIYHMDEPISTSSALAMYFVCKLAREHVTVVLTGQGADEPFAGYFRYLGERYGDYYRTIPQFVRKIIKPGINALPRFEPVKRGIRSLEIQNIDQRFVNIYSVFDDEIKSKIFINHYLVQRDLPAKIVNYWRKDVFNLNRMNQMAYIDMRLSLSDDLLLYGDKMSMAASIEARVPFLDLELTKIIEALPAKFRIRGLTQKYILKKMALKYLPKETIYRKKRGFETPIDSWFQGEMSTYIQDKLISPNSIISQYFNIPEVITLIKNHQSRRQNNQRQLFSLISFAIWHSIFIEGNRP